MHILERKVHAAPNEAEIFLRLNNQLMNMHGICPNMSNLLPSSSVLKWPLAVWVLCLPHKVKTRYLHFRSHAEHFLLSWKIPKVISRRPILFHN